MKAKYTSPRRTEISAAAGEFRLEDVIPNEGCVITVSHLGFIKRTPVADYRSQKRGGKGIIGTETYEEDFVAHLFTASTHDYILFLTSTGQCHAKKVYDVPEGSRTSKGKSVSSFLRLVEGETIASMLCVKDFAEDRIEISDAASSARDAAESAKALKETVSERCEAMADKLGLTAEQRNEIRGVQAAFSEKYKAQRDQRKTLRKEELTALGAILTPEQREKVKDYIEDHVAEAL